MPRTAQFMAGIMVATLPAGLASAETLVVANGLSPTHDVSVYGFDPWMKCVKDGTKGEIDFNYFPSGQIASVKETTGALNNGLAQVGFVSPSNESNKFPLNGIPMLPDLGNSAMEIVAAYRKVLDSDNVITKEIAANKIHPVIVNALPPYQIMSSGAAIDSLDKFSGKKVRAAGGALGITVQSMGAVPIEMSAGDMYVAMQRGTIDATILAMTSVKSYAMQELLKSMSSNANFGTSTQFIAFSAQAWDRLSPEHQKIATDCGLKVEQSLAKQLDDEDAKLKAEFASDGIDVYTLSDETKAIFSDKLTAAAKEYVGRLAERNLPAQEAYDAFRTALGRD